MAQDNMSETPLSTPDLERAEEKPRRLSTDDSSIDSSFSWHHAEGPGSMTRLPTHNSLTQTPSRIDRITSQAETAISRIRSRQPRANFSHPLTNEKTSVDVIVDFEGPDDPYRPINWPAKKKVITTLLYGMTTMTSSFASSVLSPGVGQISHEFHVIDEVGNLSTALLIFGFGLGPLVWGPLSEVYGRKLAVLTPVFVSAAFSFGCATSKDIQTLMICRFFVGFFGSAPVTNTGGVLGDLFKAETRGLAIVAYAMAVVGGPTLGPIVGGAICISHLRWRWTQYITGIFQLVMLGLDVLILDESYPASLLVAKARRLRHESGNWALHAKHEEWDVSIKELAQKYLIRPFQLLATPICGLMAFYASFVYGLIYGCLAAFPVIFVEHRGWNMLVGSLPFLALLIGILFGACVNVINNRLYISKVRQNNGKPVPEARLYPMMLGGPVLTAGIFMLGWTSNKSIPWIVPCIAIVLCGLGFFVIFQAALNYLIDTFQRTAASAIAANTFTRSVFAGAFPLFVGYELNGIGIGWGLSVFGFVSAVLIPVPYLFYIYGKRIRASSAWSRESTL
ncbi:putative MFS multidrug transporter [Polychaeton citri CBS 116435]|uniref:Cercosporin MFS transporter CTB4 n=1 Tax=Polychaeton citri CBS 116435 TaxID=1314669 RepID=A0A9P4QDH2_9PEZI|nr:putative MFS multidrug transporter [Polychaeton citri CBS 116435]